MIMTMFKAICCTYVSAVSALNGSYRNHFVRLSPDFIM